MPWDLDSQPEESEHHFVVTIPGQRRGEVLIAEHVLAAKKGLRPTLPGYCIQDAKLRVAVVRVKWDAIADAVRVEFNRRLKSTV